MAITFIAVTEIRATTGNSFSNSGSPITPTAGHALFCCATVYYNTQSGHTPTVSDGTNTWAADASGNHTAGAGQFDGDSISSAPNVAGSATTITIASNGTNNAGGVAFVYEFSGLATSSMKDANSPAIKTATSTSVSTNTLSNVTANALFIASFSNDSSNASATVTGTGGGNWTYPTGGKETDASTYAAMGTGYDIVSSVTSNNSSTWTDENVAWGALIAVYKAAASTAQIWPYLDNEGEGGMAGMGMGSL